MSPQMKLGLVVLFVAAASATVALNKEEFNNLGKLLDSQCAQQQPTVKTEKPSL